MPPTCSRSWCTHFEGLSGPREVVSWSGERDKESCQRSHHDQVK
jgi:hypothetical protein